MNTVFASASDEPAQKKSKLDDSVADTEDVDGNIAHIFSDTFTYLINS